MDLERVLNQTATVERKTGEDDYNAPAFSAPETVRARVEEAQQMVRGAGGSETLSTSQVWLADEIRVGDRVNGLDVQARENKVRVNGEVWAWVAYL